MISRLLLAQPLLLLLWLAMGAFPAWAQTGANVSGVVTDQTGAAASRSRGDNQERRHR